MNKIKMKIYIAIIFLSFVVGTLFGIIVGSLKAGQSVTDETIGISGEDQGEPNTDNMFYDSYQRKTWVVDGIFYTGKGIPLSLIISQIGDGIVEGHIALNEMVGYSCYDIREDHYPKFRGTVYNGEAHCEYENKRGEIYSLDLTFHDGNWIQAMIDGDENQSYQLRPYNVSDLYYINEPVCFETELDGWGTVSLFYANSLSNHTTPYIMLTDEQGNILYDFEGGRYYQSGTEVLDVIIRDMNQDGLADIEVITCGFDGIGEDKWCDEWYFYQQKDGTFLYDETSFTTANNLKYSSGGSQQ